ncbi:MAG: 4Fe-4S binding protein [Desulfobacterales bacterium]|nr:4Fe-4S binding protein [Desulfobacterales bacterium]
MDELYERLRKRLDDISIGYPATESKVEIRILKKLFTEEEAELFIKLTPFLETAEVVAQRLNLNLENIASKLEQMAKKGLLFRQHKDGIVRYAAVPYVVGIFEFQVKTLDKEFVLDNEEFFEKGFGQSLQSFKTPVLRSVPINREIVVNWPIAPYEDIVQIIDSQKFIAIAPCICRTLSGMNDKGCGKTVEACFVFGSHAKYYVENGMGRFISKDEAKDIAKNNEKVGLVMQPFNSQHVSGMCSCCGCCCGMLRSLKRQPSPADAVQSNYYAEIETEECIGCEACISRCQMDAIEIVDGIAKLSKQRCIGCGLCVTTCPSDAIKLIKKAEDKIYVPPKTGADTYMQIAVERNRNPLAPV